MPLKKKLKLFDIGSFKLQETVKLKIIHTNTKVNSICGAIIQNIRFLEMFLAVLFFSLLSNSHVS